MADMCFSISTL